ncbi:TPA: BapA prefix-like domain-containing protein [Enterobacter kobei]|uniref:Type I secretion C-terminal target domain-containing protein n=1 Tax=Enterobacter cloacae TaxID=550 RepID=A0A6S5JW50_ENTCL|nr:MULTISPECIES: BapA/Bap/LapF family large adhesin [Enterobacter cloacae complex]MDD9236401.1 Ig-like domain-containing protein [Enterobacter kobei]SAZ52294.1 outer membrane adhesin like protein [Enterobacter kobei]BBS33574.1 type I secretion C-terminal target domain-containing protein [Enterobacter cloacae]HDS7683539.1 BapA prefix-like domain-containing protein [Enterobacter kobei]HDS7757149.1 BapA prefix-like domain-containing protein [Enterobacter kobei]
MSQISVISKLTGVETTTEGTQVTLSHSSIVELHVERADVSHFARSGNDLVVTLHSGEVITLKNFYVTDAQGVSQLVLQDSGGALWWIEDPAGAATYESIASTDVLLAASGSDTGGAAIWPWALGGIVAAGGIAAAASSGGGGGGDDDNNGNPNPNPDPGTPGEPSTPDTTPPNAPSSLTFSSDGKTVTGTAEPGSTITLKDANGNVIGTGKTGSDGNFTVSLGTPLINGEHVTATATDAAGNTSQSATVTAPDLTAPDAPTIGSVTDDVGPQTGALTNGSSTNDQRPQLSGTAEAGSTVTIYDGGIAIGTAVVSSNGTWTFTPSVDLSESTHQITVRATDAAGNTGPASPVFTLTVDLTPPATPTAIVLTDDTGTIRGTITSGTATDASKPILAGTGEPGGTITIYDNGVVVGTTTVLPNGTWSIRPDGPLPDGAHSITVVETDAAGNQSAASAPITFTVDTTPPLAPGNLVVSNDGGSISGTAEPGSTVTIRDGNVILGTSVADSEGNFTLTLTPPKLNGETLTANATDAAGNTGPATAAAAPDTTPPQTPVIVSVIDDVQATTGPVGQNGLTNDRAPTLNGTGEPGSTITISNGSDILGTVNVPSSGLWSFTPPVPLSNGTYVFTATATDAAGNPSGQSNAWTITVDGTAPDAPVITQVVDDAPGGTLGSLNLNDTTNDATPTLSGTAEANATVTIRADGVVIGTTVADGLGAWSFTPSTPLGEGPHTLTAVATDAAGNTSGVSNSWGLIIDSVAPATPVITQVVDDAPEGLGALSPNGSTNDTTPTLNGTAEPGSTVTIRLDGADLVTVPVGSNGTWTYTPTAPLGEGPHTFTVVATDAAGNTSLPSTGFNIIVDTTPPVAATIASVTDDVGGVQGPLSSGDTTDDTQPLLQGTAPPDAVVTVYDGTTLLGTAILDGSGGWSFTPVTPLTDGPHSLTVHTTDAAGNTTVSSPFVLTVDTVAPATPDIPAITVNPDGTETPLNPGETTRDTTPTLSGTGNPGDTVTIYNGGVKLDDVVVDGTGNWTWTPATPLPNGTYDITLTVTNMDGTGNESAPSQPVTITIDTDPPATPAAPVITDSVSQVTGPVPDGGTTNDPRPVLSGTGTANDVINITDTVNGIPTVVGTVTVDSTGNWSWRPDSNIGEGSHVYTATATDEAGNVSAASPAITITVDTVAPDTPVISAVGGEPSGGFITDATPTVGGTGVNGETVIVYNNGVELGRVVVANGEWNIDLPAQTDGPLNITVAGVDAAGNVSAPSPVFTVTLDTVAPEIPQINAVSDSQLTNNVLYTRDGVPTLTGTGEPGSTVVVSVDGTPSAVPVTVQPNGSWTWTADSTLADGQHTFTVSASDPAGNTSASSAPLNVTVDTLDPTAPDNLNLAAEGTPLTGTAEAGSIITVMNGSTVIGTGVVDSTGNFSIAVSPAPQDGATLTVSATDASGRTSPDATYNVIGTLPNLPDIPVITAINDDAAPLTGDVKGKTTNDITPTLTGTAEAGSLVTIYQDGGLTPVATVTADGSGNWSYTPAALGEGLHSFEVTATLNGATSGRSPAASVTVDLTAPGAPTIGAVIDDVGPGTGPLTNGQTTNDNQPTLTGTGAVGDTISVYNNGTLLGSVVVGNTGTWSFTPPSSLAEGTHVLTIRETDPAGNQSAPSAGFTVVVDTVSTTPVITNVTDDVGNTATTVVSGTPTNDATPTLSGTAEANSVVTIFDGGTQIGVVTADGTGAWTFTPETALAEGSHSFTAQATDPQGNVSAVSGAWSVVVDLTAPTVPTLDTVNDNVPGGITGNLTSGQVTNDSTPTIGGTGQAGSTIHIMNNGTQIGTAIVDGSGNWSFTPTTPLVDGSYALRVYATDVAGNASANSSVFTFTVDTAGPVVPVVTSVIDDIAPVTGTLTSGNTTNDARPTFNGTGDVGSTVHVIVDGNEIGTAVVNAQGNWTFTPGSDLSDGPHAITFNATDAAGNTGSTTAPFNLTVDTGVPSAPVISTAADNVGSVQTPLSSGQSTDDTTPTLNGTATANATVTVYENGQPIGTALADGTGAWSFTPSTPLSSGSHTWTATVTDAAGNVSPASPGFTLVVDTTAPNAPVISQAIDDVGSITGPITSGQTTDDTVPRLVGTSEPFATVNIYEGTTLVGTGTADGTGNWSILLNTTLTTGAHSFTAQATDAAGNTSVSSASFSLTIDTTPPALPVLTSILDDVGNAATPVANGGLTNDAQPTLSGTAEAGSTVKIFDNGVQIGSVTATGGAWSFTPSPALGNGSHNLTFTATDAAGNVSAPTAGYVINVDTLAPSAPVISSVVDDVGSVTGPITGPTNDTRPTLNGTAEANATVRIYDGITLVGTVTADASGNWTLPQTTTTLTQGTHNFTATATDAAGNTSVASTVTTIIVDTTAPTAPTGTFNADGSVLTGNAEAGSTVSIRLADGSTVTAIAGSNGTYSYTFTNKQTEGQTLQITATDAAGNTSLPGSALAPVVPLSASNNVEELDLSTTATVTNSQYSDYGFLLVGAVGNVLTLLGNDTAQVNFTVGNGGSADIVVNANATGAVLSLLNTLELVVQHYVNGAWTTVVDTGQPQFADLLTLGATGVSLNLTGLADGNYRVLSYNTNLLATGSYTSLDVAVKETGPGTVTGDTSLNGNVILDTDPTAGSDNAPAGTTISAVTNAQGVTTNINADGTVVQGQYGTLTINRDGSYSYTLTDTSAAVIGRTESFTYTITHNGVSASAQLVVSLGTGTVSNGIVAVDDTNALTFDTSVHEINNGTSSQGGFTLVGINLGNTLGLNLLDDMTNPIIYNVEEGTTRTMTIQASVGGVALASVFDLYVYKFNNATQTFEQVRVESGWLRAPLLGGTSSQLTLQLPAGEYLFLLNTASGITALTAYTLSVLQDHVYSVSSISETTTGDVLANDPVPAGTLVTEVNGVAVNGTGTTTIQGEYGTLTINSSGQYTYTLRSGVGVDHISTPDTFVYTVTAPDGTKDTASLNITPTAQPMNAVNDVSAVMDVTSVHHTSAYSDTTVGTASWTTALLSSTQGSGSGTFVVDPNTALHNASLHFNVASLLSLGGLTVNWTISDGSGVIRSGSFGGISLLNGSIDVPLTGLDLNAGTYTLSYTGSVPGLSVGNITITPSVNGTTYSLTDFDATGTHTVNGNIFDGTDSGGVLDQLHSVDTRVSITGYNGVTTTLDPYTGSATVNITGHYGTLAIAADGHYTYTLNSGVSLSSMTSKETFNYTLTDATGKTDSASLTINMAPQFISSEHNDVITGTAYGDTLIYQVLNNTVGNATGGNVSSTAGDHWTGFSLAQGDKIDISDLLVGWNGSASTLGNYLHVTNSNGNTVISIDRDGAGSTYTNTTLVTLDGVQTTYDELVNQQHIITT